MKTPEGRHLSWNLMIASGIFLASAIRPAFAQENGGNPGLRMEDHRKITVFLHASPWVFSDDLWKVIEQEFQQHGLQAFSAYNAQMSGEGELIVKAMGGPRYRGGDVELYESSVRLEYRRPVEIAVGDERIATSAITWWGGESSTMTRHSPIVIGEPDPQPEAETFLLETMTDIEEGMRTDLCRMVRGEVRQFIRELLGANGGDPSSVDWPPRDPEGLPDCV
ncbi:MAG: hypothetical protein ACRELU_13430 [Gemmatimonadota bacterium]